MLDRILKNKERWAAILIGFAGLILMWPRLSPLLQQMITVDISDEVFYIDRALDYLHGKNIAFLDWGPLYSLWYALLLHVKSDPLQVYFLNLTLLLFLIPILAFFYLLRKGSGPLWALLCSFFLLFMDGNLYFNRRPNHFSLLIILLMLHLLPLCKNRSRQLNLMAFFALILSYVRPEFFLSYLFCSAILFLWISRNYIRNPLDTDFITESTLFIVYSFLIFHMAGGLPLDLSASGKALYSFKDYIYFSYKGLHPDTTLTLEQVFNQLFPGVRTFTEVMLTNPTHVLRHMAYNLKNFTPEFYSMLSAHALLGQAALLPLFVLIPLFFLKGVKRNFFKHNDLMLIAFVLPGIISMAMYGVLDRYIYTLVVLFILFLAHNISPLVKIPFKGQIVLTSFLILIMTSLPLQHLVDKPSPILKGGEHFQVIQFLRKLRPAHLDEKITLFVKEGFPRQFLGEDYQTFNLFNYFIQAGIERPSSVSTFFQENKIGLIWVDSQLLWSAAHSVEKKYQQEFAQFFQQPEKWGYKKIEIPGNESYLLAQQRLEFRKNK